jgi:hypothetical protein
MTQWDPIGFDAKTDHLWAASLRGASSAPPLPVCTCLGPAMPGEWIESAETLETGATLAEKQWRI